MGTGQMAEPTSADLHRRRRALRLEPASDTMRPCLGTASMPRPAWQCLPSLQSEIKATQNLKVVPVPSDRSS